MYPPIQDYRDCSNDCETPTCKLPFKNRYHTNQYKSETCCRKVEYYKGKCGVNLQGGRIVGGTKAQSTTWPWIGLFKIGRAGCAATLISPEWALTAAHCVQGMSVFRMKLRFGVDPSEEDDIQMDKFPDAHYSYVTEAHYPDDYKFPQNDIALLKLSNPVEPDQETETIRTICLPKGEIMPPDTKCFVAGWGTQKFGANSIPSQLMQAEIRILDPKICLARGSYESYNFNKDTMICAGFIRGGVDACQGDSGGPLMCQRCSSCEWTLQGVVSWGKECARESYPGIYARVGAFTSWINEKTGTSIASGNVPSCESI